MCLLPSILTLFLADRAIKLLPTKCHDASLGAGPCLLIAAEQIAGEAVKPGPTNESISHETHLSCRRASGALLISDGPGSPEQIFRQSFRKLVRLRQGLCDQVWRHISQLPGCDQRRRNPGCHERQLRHAGVPPGAGAFHQECRRQQVCGHLYRLKDRPRQA